jgi:hypothetical protein
MTGLTSPADSPAGQAAAAARKAYKQEDYISDLAALRDDELRERIRETVALEQEAMQEWLDSGDCYIVSLAGKVHLPTCDSMKAVCEPPERLVSERALSGSTSR